MAGSEEMELVARLRTGDRAALEQAYHCYKSDIVALAGAMLGTRDGAWDILHDVFVSLARVAPGLAVDSNLKGYLLTAAANRARDVLSKRRTVSVDPMAAGEPQDRGAEDPAEIVSRDEQVLAAWRVMASLPAEQREVIALRIYGSMSFAEIAIQQGIPEKTAQSRYRYAIDKIRRSLTGGA